MIQPARQYYKDNQEDREAWRDEMPELCMRCGGRRLLQTHEMERRSQAPKTWAHRCNYLLLCEDCHAGPFAAMPHPWQLAFKLVRDPKHFDLKAWLMLRDPDLRAPDRVTLEDIAEFLEVVE